MCHISLVRVACLLGLATSINLQQAELYCDPISNPILGEFSGACKPGFMVLGPQKCGTSTLWEMMSQHPNIVGSDIKEPNWFPNGNGNVPSHYRCGTSPQDFNAYLSKFFKGGQQKMRDHRNVAGEWSATYLHCACCPEVLHAFMPHLRLIAILRHPIQRALSRYAEQHDAIHDIPDTASTFDDYVSRHLPLLRECLSTATTLPAQTTCLADDNILGPSIYDIPIKNYLVHFSPDQLLVTYMETLAGTPAKLMERIESHLKLNHHVYKNINNKFNAEGDYGWDKASLLAAQKTVRKVEDNLDTHPISEKTRTILYDFYRPHMMRLKELADQGRTELMPQRWIQQWKLSDQQMVRVSSGGQVHAVQSHSNHR